MSNKLKEAADMIDTLRVKSMKEAVTEKDLYDVQMILFQEMDAQQSPWIPNEAKVYAILQDVLMQVKETNSEEVKVKVIQDATSRIKELCTHKVNRENMIDDNTIMVFLRDASPYNKELKYENDALTVASAKQAFRDYAALLECLIYDESPWIKCSERLPPDNDRFSRDVNVLYADGTVSTAKLLRASLIWVDLIYVRKDFPVSWQPLPLAPEKGDGK